MHKTKDDTLCSHLILKHLPALPDLPTAFSPYSIQAVGVAIDTAWVLIGAVMVFFMQVRGTRRSLCFVCSC